MDSASEISNGIRTGRKTLSFKHRFFLWFVDHFVDKFIRILKRTVNLDVVGEEHLNTAFADSGKAIFAFWHGNMIIPMLRHIDQGIYVLVSKHGDGEIIARLLINLGYRLVRGSSTKGGSDALKAMTHILQEPNIIAITPDGPRGPLRELKIGPVALSQRTGVPVIPMSASTSSPVIFKSWDRFLFVKPFVKCVLLYGKPIYVENGLTDDGLKQKRREVEQAIRALDTRAENHFKNDNSTPNNL